MSFFNIINGIRDVINNTRNYSDNNTINHRNDNINHRNNEEKLYDLPVFRYRKVDKIKCKSCAICLEDYKEGDFIPYFKCGHYLHYDCFKECLLYKNKNENFYCPICRQDIMRQSFVNESKKKRKEFLDRTHSL